MMFPHDRKPYIIAEIGANHNGDMALARQMIDVAKECGADAVKFQSWDTTIFSHAVYEKNYFLGDDYRDRTDYTLRQIVEEFAVSFEDLKALRSYCDEVGIDFSSTPFNEKQLDDLVALGAKYIKIASMDVTNPRLLRHAAQTGLPVILSTGFAEMDEIDRAVRWLEEGGCAEIVLLHCVSLYPPEDDEVRLDNIDMLREVYGYPVGFSDHTTGTEIPIAAIAKRSVVIEKHYTLDRAMFGWDHHMSCTPEELKAICTARDRIHPALGGKRRIVPERERTRRDEYRRSIVAARPIAKGATVSPEDIDYRRPGTGLAPTMTDLVVGAVTRREIAEDALIGLNDIVQPDDA
ncbi:MAG: N-acetylneuraminate synthase family protein [Marivibrio sp.]|uniref:N-acetylneuraminate synthase family protein n=1 Tax=Marivibrio sp. TaxID=2039719 RepID=UPI0032EAFA1B